MIFSIVAALIASVTYGVSDFLGAIAAMRLRVHEQTSRVQLGGVGLAIFASTVIGLSLSEA